VTLKPLLIKLPFGSDLNKVIRYAYAEGKTVFKLSPRDKVRVVDCFYRSELGGWIVVVENTSGCVEVEKRKIGES